MGADVQACQSLHAADITTGQDGRAARRQICLFTDNTWIQSIHQYSAHTHAHAVSLSNTGQTTFMRKISVTVTHVRILFLSFIIT